RPLRPGFGARRERPVPRPHHDRGPAVPPVQRVAVVAHVALVLGLVGREVRARGAGTHLGVGDIQRDRLTARAVRAGPPAEGDLVVYQVIELVLIVVAAPVPGGVVVVVFLFLVVIVVVVPRVAVGRPGVPCLLHLGERQHRLAPGT